jgi:hypothetical protein
LISATSGPVVPTPDDDYDDDVIDECEVVSRMRIGKGNRSTLRKPATVPFCPPQIPHDMT